jgi:hypothetical protein
MPALDDYDNNRDDNDGGSSVSAVDSTGVVLHGDKADGLDAENEIAATESRLVAHLRHLVGAVLSAAAVAVSTGVYLLTARAERQNLLSPIRGSGANGNRFV